MQFASVNLLELMLETYQGCAPGRFQLFFPSFSLASSSYSDSIGISRMRFSTLNYIDDGQHK